MSFEELSCLDSDRRSGDGDGTFGVTLLLLSCLELDLLDFSGVAADVDFFDFFEEWWWWCFERRLWPPRLLELLLLLLESSESEEPDDDEDAVEDEEDDDEEDEEEELEDERERFFLGRLLESSSLEDRSFLSSPVPLVRFLAFSSYSSWWDDLRFLLAAAGSSRRAAADLLLLGRTFFTGVESRSGAESSWSSSLL